MPQIWAKNSSLLPEERCIQNLMLKWDQLQTSWIQNDILGCILPNNTSEQQKWFKFVWRFCMFLQSFLMFQLKMIYSILLISLPDFCFYTLHSLLVYYKNQENLVQPGQPGMILFLKKICFNLQRKNSKLKQSQANYCSYFFLILSFKIKRVLISFLYYFRWNSCY